MYFSFHVYYQIILIPSLFQYYSPSSSSSNRLFLIKLRLLIVDIWYVIFSNDSFILKLSISLIFLLYINSFQKTMNVYELLKPVPKLMSKVSLTQLPTLHNSHNQHLLINYFHTCQLDRIEWTLFIGGRIIFLINSFCFLIVFLENMYKLLIRFASAKMLWIVEIIELIDLLFSDREELVYFLLIKLEIRMTICF